MRDENFDDGFKTGNVLKSKKNTDKKISVHTTNPEKYPIENIPLLNRGAHNKGSAFVPLSSKSS